MLNPQELLIDACATRLEHSYARMYGGAEPHVPQIITWACRMALETISNSDALYHDVEHTVMVTLVGQEILRGRHLAEGGITPRDWLHFSLSLLCHDIGYVRGICREDQGGRFSTGRAGETVSVPEGATDAAMTPYHVDRGKHFIRERFGGHKLIDAEEIGRNIELTRFPVPKDTDHQGTLDLPGLVRAADLVGQLADPSYLRKLPRLFAEFQETGANDKLGYHTPADLRRGYAGFFWNVVTPYIRDSLRYLQRTHEGKQWIASLYAHVFAVEHEAPPHSQA
ncbi:MAG: metal-dependent phosphohydrolase [Deltaproteobacteria bacterium]|nr:metal-dependent phosphohydrolase [Deltaproteobacteria bacterium]